MEQQVGTRKKIVKIAIWIVVMLALMGSAHILINYFDIMEIFKVMHGG